MLQFCLLDCILLLVRVTIRPLFGGHVLLFHEKYLVLRGRQKMPKCPPFRHFEQIKHVHSRSLLVYKYIIS